MPIHVVELQFAQGVNGYSAPSSRTAARDAPSLPCRAVQAHNPAIIVIAVDRSSTRAALGGPLTAPNSPDRARQHLVRFSANVFTPARLIALLRDARRSGGRSLSQHPCVCRIRRARRRDPGPDRSERIQHELLHDRRSRLSRQGAVAAGDRLRSLGRRRTSLLPGLAARRIQCGGRSRAVPAAAAVDGSARWRQAFLRLRVTVQSHPPFVDRASGASMNRRSSLRPIANLASST